MKGFVPTPPDVVDAMVTRLFHAALPTRNSAILDPGCGTGAFIHGIARWCRDQGRPLPRIVGVEQDADLVREARQSVAGLGSVRILNEDFLTPRTARFDYVIANPPYVPITGLSELERKGYRERYRTARGRFDLYLLFFEEALGLLKPAGRLVFLTPEKFLYVQTAAPLRRAMAELSVESIQLIDERTFEGLTTYPTITSVVNTPPNGQTKLTLRSGGTRQVQLPSDGSSWLPAMNGIGSSNIGYTLSDVCVRISCGVATGADSVFVTPAADLNQKLQPFAYRTIAGREISIEKGATVSHAMLVPYAKSGELLQENQLGELGVYLAQPERRRRLLERTCVRRKPWYAFHENPPLADILRPKILCKDITARPFFVLDEAGQLVPRHSVYYIVPKEPSRIHDLRDYLNSPGVQDWLTAHCQRAANGFLRLQSHVLKMLPVPSELARGSQLSWYDASAASGDSPAISAAAR